MIFSRELLEEMEIKTLAPYGIASRNSHGRLYPDHEPDYRTCFQRDRDRILHTTAFRRLEYKTQVFINYEGDYYRTRLTHTLEVAQIGRTLARALGGNEDLTETICLAQQTGFSAFGHAGETSLSKLMVDHGGFDHNKQSFRIVTELEKRYPEFPGLNLSWEVLEGIVKHETEYDVSDARDFNPDLHAGLEAQIANVSDELAYTAHDLDDGLRSGLITPDMLEGVELWEILRDNTRWRDQMFTEQHRHQIIRNLIGLEVTNLIQTTEHNLVNHSVRSVEDLQHLSFNVVTVDEELARRNRQLKDFLYANLYRNFRLVRMSVKAERVLTDLFNAYRSSPTILPRHIQEWIPERGLERAICDYLAGMTDRYAVEEHQKLFDPLVLP